MDPLVLTQLILVVAKALEAGVDISVRLDALISTARAEGREIGPDDLDALASETNRLRNERREKLAAAADQGDAG